MKRALLGVLVLMNSAGAFAKGNEDYFKGGEICSVESEDIILKRKLQYYKCPTEFAFIKCFKKLEEDNIYIILDDASMINNKDKDNSDFSFIS